MIADVGGEVRYYVRDGGHEGFSLTRAERSESDRFIMSCGELIDIERYLAVELADDVREREGLVRLRIPGRMGEHAAGVRAREDDGTVTIVVGERPPVRFVKRDPYRPQPDVQVSHFAHASVAEIVESALSPSGIYATLEGREYDATRSPGIDTSALSWSGVGEPPEGFTLSRTMPHVFIRVVPVSMLKSWITLNTTCSFAGGGPFRIDTVIGRTVYATYQDSDLEWAKSLPDCEFGDMYQTGGSLAGFFDVSAAEDVREDTSQAAPDPGST